MDLSRSFYTTKKFTNIFTLVGIGAAGVGIFPENTGTPHVISALIVFICSGVRVNVVRDALKAGADILVVGRAITASKDIKRAADEFIVLINTVISFSRICCPYSVQRY